MNPSGTHRSDARPGSDLRPRRSCPGGCARDAWKNFEIDVHRLARVHHLEIVIAEVVGVVMAEDFPVFMADDRSDRQADVIDESLAGADEASVPRLGEIKTAGLRQE